MMLVTKNTDYAIKALMYMAKKKKGLFSVSELAEKLKIPGPFLRRLLQILNKEGILTSYKGKGGGFELARPANKIFVTNLIKIFQGPIKFTRCIIKEGICPDVKSCVLRKEIKKIENYVSGELKSVSIGSLLNEDGKNS